MPENNEINTYYIRRKEAVYHAKSGIQHNIERVFLIAQTKDDHFEIGFEFFRRAGQWQRKMCVELELFTQLKPFLALLECISNNCKDNTLNNPDRFCDFVSDVFQVYEQN